jgi:hypothetical protein
VVAAASQAAAALAEVCRRRHRLAMRVRGAAATEVGAQVGELERRAAATADPAAREAWGRAAGALRERTARAASLSAVIDRIDARVHAAVAELEGTALAVGTRAELSAGDPPAALAAACDRLRAADADLDAECEALAEMDAV